MNRPARRLLLRLAAPLTLAWLLAATATGAAQQPSKEFLQGTEAFRYILHDLRFEPLNQPQQLREDPANSLLVVFGDTAPLDFLQIPEALAMPVSKFVESGGALLVATDRAHVPLFKGFDSWTDEFGVEVVEQPVLGRPHNCYQSLRECPFVIPVEGSDPPLFEQLKHGVATNRSGFLRITRSAVGSMLSPLARFPRGCDSERAESIMERAGYLPFAAGRKWGKGRIVVLADHSIFINNMMLQHDTGNVEFTYNCLLWLRSGGNDPRDHVLFYDNGQIITNFNVPVRIPPLRLPEIEDPVALADEFITGLEDEDMHNRMLLTAISHDRLLKYVAIALTVVLALVGLTRLVRSRHRTDVAAPLLAPTLAKLAPVGAGLAPRHRALLAEGNLWEPTRALARDFFETALQTHEPPKGPDPPPFQASEGWLSRRALHKQIASLWRLAYAAWPRRVPPAEFARLAAQVDELKAALADGTLRFG
jgi:hypothetical protein